mmetsp:Transcript_4463/g.3741  ORF Transcript_4463/g.3741 Transcript_4463/m.3741 type:complete len:115 (+) Transcript_4463:55-399(+)
MGCKASKEKQSKKKKGEKKDRKKEDVKNNDSSVELPVNDNTDQRIKLNPIKEEDESVERGTKYKKKGKKDKPDLNSSEDLSSSISSSNVEYSIESSKISDEHKDRSEDAKFHPI